MTLAGALRLALEQGLDALDAQLLGPLANAPHAQLVLCGTRHACVVQSEASVWPSWWRAWRAPTLQQALLDR